MNKNKKTHKYFLEFVRNGLWGGDMSLSQHGDIDYPAIFQLAEKQSMVGVVTAGLEKLQNVKVPQELALRFIGITMQTEQRNIAMNKFIEDLVERMRKTDIYVILVKGQGVAQCYEKPLWRQSGDVDFLLSEDNYKKAKKFLLSLSSGNKHEERYSQHLGMNIGQWYVEIHGTMRGVLSYKVDKMIDAVQRDIFYGGNVRSWQNGKIQVFLPAPNQDVILIFAHVLQHFYKEGVGLKQICDWCRLLWVYRDEIDKGWLGKQLMEAGLLIEWQVFGAMAVKELGMPEKAMPFYDPLLTFKGLKLVEFILRGYTGNKMKDTWQIAKIFPWKVLRYSPSIFLNVNWMKVRERLFK